MNKTDRNVAMILLAVILLVLGIAVGSKWMLSRAMGPTRADVAAAPKPSPPSAPTKRLKVGVYMSKLTGDQWGVSAQIVNELLKGGFELLPVIEKDTQGEKGIINLINTWFAGKPLIDAADAAALKKLDVLVTPRIWLLPEESRVAIEAAVTSGVGLLARNGLGCMDPGSGPDVSRLSGFEDSEFGYNPHPMECEVIGSHPILGNLSGKTGQVISITPNGTWGIPNATLVPLIRVKDMEKFRAFYTRGGADDWTFYPLYVAQLGKGRIVGCQFPAWSPMPKDLMAATDSQFNIRAIRWLAGELDEPTTAPATTRSTVSVQ